MKAYRTLIAMTTIAALSLGVVTVGGAISHPTYALGKAKACRTGYVKRTETHVVKGKRVRYVACVYLAPVTTTTKGGDPPTAISITPSESPAIVGDTITYSMTVADVLTSTLGAVYMTDNGQTLTGCTGPTPTNQGSLAYSCDVKYTDAGSHLIVGIFLGDATYGQSAGQLNEVVQLTATPVAAGSGSGGVSAPAPTTTTTTTTTTTLPPPTLTLSIAATDEFGSPITQPVVSGNYGFTASVLGSATGDPNPPGTWTFSVTPTAILDPGAWMNFSEFHFATGSYTVTVNFVPNDVAYAGVTAQASYVLVVS